MIERDKENATNASPCNLTAYSVAEYILLQYKFKFRYHFTVMTSGTSANKNMHHMDHIESCLSGFEAFFWKELWSPEEICFFSG